MNPVRRLAVPDRFARAGALAAVLLSAACVGVVSPDGDRGSGAAAPGRAGAGAAGSGAASGIGPSPSAPSSGAGAGTGVTGGGELPRSTRCQGANAAPGPSPVRRLTRTEYNNTVADLLGDTSSPAAGFPAEGQANGFDNNAALDGVSVLLVEQYEQVAERLARRYTQDPAALMGCRPATPAAEDTCARQFVESFGLRAFRRPLAPEEIERHVAFYAASKAKYGFATGVRLVMQAMLQSPYFLYRVEGGATVAQTPTVVKAAPFELASRLSYLIWSSMPDKALFDAAAMGRLATAADVAREARRMLDDTRAKQGVRNFFSQWLETAHVEGVTKDAKTFSTWTPRIASLMRRETETFVEEVVLRGDSSMPTLLRADHTYADKELATFYALRGPTGATFEKVAVDPARRSGLLTHGSLLAALAGPRQTSPVARGFYVRDRLLCAPPPPAPANINVTPPEPDGRSTTRERFAQHRADPACASCHALMDPLGLGFESFDGVGRWRDQDAGRPVDASGEVRGTRDADGAFVGAVELATRLAASGQVRECLARQYFRFAFARLEQDQDACTVEALGATLGVATGGSGPPGSIRQLLVGLTQADPFLLRTVEMGGTL